MDPIADMFVRIKNAYANKEEKVNVPSSKIKGEILNVLKKENYITNFEEKEVEHKKHFIVHLKYNGKKSAIEHLKRISKPGLRIYKGCKNIPMPLQGMGLVIVSTPQGIMSGKEAKKKKIGGEIISEVY